MASVSISHLILFIASLLIAAGVVGVAFTGVDHFNEAMEDRSITAAENLRTDVTIISDAGSDGIYDDGNVTLLIKNTGDIDLHADERAVDILVDGQFVGANDLELTVLDSGEPVWRQSEVLQAEIQTGGLDPGDHRITVIVNGDEEEFAFRVEEEI